MYKFIAMSIFFIMFIYSGISKISNIKNLSKTLEKKSGLPYTLSTIGIIGAIILEVAGSIILISDKLYPIYPELLIHFTYLVYFLFIVLVTILYHPFSKEPYKFMKNLSIIGALIYMYVDYLESCSIKIFMFL